MAKAMSADASEYYFAGLAVTSIAVKSKEGDENKVTFSEADPNGEEGVFLKNFKLISDESVEKGKREFEATKVDLDEVKSMIYKDGSDVIPLFIVHGFNVEPSSTLAYNYENFHKEHKYYPIPVIWASEGSTLLYFEDQADDAIGAGKALNALVGVVPNDTFPKKSLVMHSMGNHAIFNGACAKGTPDVQFDDIFMVAADVPFDIFHKEPNEFYLFRKNVSGRKYEKATNFFGMLKKEGDKPVGKIYVLYHKKDVALAASFFTNQESRIGKTGLHWVDGWFRNYYDDKATREDMKPYLECWDVTDQEMTYDKGTKHSYQLEPWAVSYYESKI